MPADEVQRFSGLEANDSNVLQASNNNNSNSLVNAHNTYHNHNLVINLGDASKILNMKQLGLYAIHESASIKAQLASRKEETHLENSTSAQEGRSSPEQIEEPTTPRPRISTSSGSQPLSQPPSAESQSAMSQARLDRRLRDDGYCESMGRGLYPQYKVKMKEVTHDNDLPLPEHTPPNIAMYMKSLPRLEKDVIPLWSASPSGRTCREIVIGDVGVFNKQGGFETKFNIFKTLQENIDEGLDPPPDFSAYGPAPCQVESIIKDWNDASGMTSKVSISSSGESRRWTCSSQPSMSINAPDYSCGLYLPDGGTKFWIDTGDIPHVLQFADRNVASWYCYKNMGNDGQPLSEKFDARLWNKSLVLVTDVWKASAWFSVLTTDRIDYMERSAPQQRREIKATVQTCQSSSPQYSYTFDTGLRMNTGPDETAKSGQKNQCVAIRGVQLVYDPRQGRGPTARSAGETSSFMSKISVFSRMTRKTKKTRTPTIRKS
ncbi:unnamed protein product [Cyclocybe aegerita]|uniref:Uncharacterized protein n=1 Tax=Cyclocybe aegerita TaxID=1973307 RepID=A0A8S0VUY6_CYCAE|nr:unnamed protein product [Cyclocybe aegerita]